MAWPLRNWKNLAATLLGARRSWGLMTGLEAVVDSLKTLLPEFLLSMSSRHSWVAARSSCVLKRRGYFLGSWSSGGGGCRLSRPLVCLFVSLHSPVGRGPSDGDGVALGYEPPGESDHLYCYLLSRSRDITDCPPHRCLRICKTVKSCPFFPCRCRRRRPYAIAASSAL